LLSSQKKGVKTEEISGLALALLFDRDFMDLFDFNNKPLRRFRLQQPLPKKKQTRRAAGKGVFLNRF
jgi:hypothetical protein